MDGPSDADPAGEWYAFEKGIEKMGGGDGWADVWLRGHFAWEYKGRKADLRGAFMQLQTYRDSLELPPLLVVCDLDRFEIHTATWPQFEAPAAPAGHARSWVVIFSSRSRSRHTKAPAAALALVKSQLVV